jgi:hypothetical protein
VIDFQRPWSSTTNCAGDCGSEHRSHSGTGPDHYRSSWLAS